jgi:hypothetical protein
MNSYSSYTDSELSGLLKIGDRVAYNEIYNRYKVILFSYAYKRTVESHMHHALTILKARLGSLVFLILFIRP